MLPFFPETFQLLPISLLRWFWRPNLDHRAEERLVVVLAWLRLPAIIFMRWVKLRPIIVDVAPHKEVVANDTETPEHVRRVLAVLAQTVAQTVVNTASCRH